MNDNIRYPNNFREISLQAVQCAECFACGDLKRPLVDRAQPRWAGPGYADASPRIALMMLNPGGGEGRRDGADAAFRDLLNRFAAGENLLDQIMEHQRADIQNWGQGRLLRFLQLVGLNLDEIALINIAWCATAQNKYPAFMLQNCFQRHTLEALSALKPDVVILLGTKAQEYTKQIQKALPNATLIQTLHFAHRKPAPATEDTARQVRLAIRALEQV
jgi:hypothetical protein